MKTWREFLIRKLPEAEHLLKVRLMSLLSWPESPSRPKEVKLASKLAKRQDTKASMWRWRGISLIDSLCLSSHEISHWNSVGKSRPQIKINDCSLSVYENNMFDIYPGRYYFRRHAHIVRQHHQHVSYPIFRWQAVRRHFYGPGFKNFVVELCPVVCSHLSFHSGVRHYMVHDLK